MNKILIDSHVHIYPQFDIPAAIDKSIKNFQSQNSLTYFWLLTERSDCFFYDSLLNSSQKIKPPYTATILENGKSVRIHQKNENINLYIIPGRQIIAKDGLEFCALFCSEFIENHFFNSPDLIYHINQNNGLPVLNWAPGKWFFSRGKIVKSLIETHEPGQFFIGDTSMRPSVWKTPSLMSHAQEKGFNRLCGSDPLPFDGEENLIGSYGISVIVKVDPQNPSQSLKLGLYHPDTKFDYFGTRSSFLPFIKRQVKIMLEKSRRS
jgi:hypothetical protein